MNTTPNASVRGSTTRRGVRLVGTGSALPSKLLTNADLEKMMNTSDEWIVQRTGIHTRNIIDKDKGESTSVLAARALERALADARLTANDLDLIIVSTMTGEMQCPPCACLVANAVKANRCGAFDINGACCGFVFGMNVVHEMIRGGAYSTVALVGADCLSTVMEYSDHGRGTAILFGDAAGAAIFKATDDANLGILAQSMHSDGERWKEIYIPEENRDFPPGVTPDPRQLGHVFMNGAGVFKFAVGTFPNLIQETLDKASLKASDIDMFVCHQSNARILTAARERFGLSEDKLYVNIGRVGNTVAASVPLCLDELRRAGRVHEGMKVMFLGFGGGLTWGSSLWQL